LTDPESFGRKSSSAPPRHPPGHAPVRAQHHWPQRGRVRPFPGRLRLSRAHIRGPPSARCGCPALDPQSRQAPSARHRAACRSRRWPGRRWCHAVNRYCLSRAPVALPAGGNRLATSEPFLNSGRTIHVGQKATLHGNRHTSAPPLESDFTGPTRPSSKDARCSMKFETDPLKNSGHLPSGPFAASTCRRSRPSFRQPRLA